MTSAHDRIPKDGPGFGAPGHIAWAEATVRSEATNLQQGFPLAAPAQFLTPPLALRGERSLLQRAGIQGIEIPGARDWPPPTPDAPLFLQRVDAADLWEDQIEVLAFDRLMGEALAIGCQFGQAVEFILAADRGGPALEAALRGATPPRLVGRGTTPLTVVPPRPPKERPVVPKLGEPGYIEWFRSELEGSGLRILEQDVPEDWPDEFDTVDAPTPALSDFLEGARASGVNTIVLRQLEPADWESEDPEAGRDEDDLPDAEWLREVTGPWLIAGYHHNGRVITLPAFDGGGAEARAGLAGREVAIQEEMEATVDRIVGKAMASLTFTFDLKWEVHPDQIRAAEMDTAAPVAPTAEMLWEEVASHQERLKAYYDRIGHAPPLDELYTDFTTGQPIPPRLRPLVDAVVHDSSYDLEKDRDRVVRRHARHLRGSEYEIVANGAYYTYKYTLYKALSWYAIPWARDLLTRPDARADLGGKELEAWVHSHLPDGLEPRLLPHIVDEARRRLRRRANAARILADDLYTRLDPALLDRLGFTARLIDRHALLAEQLQSCLRAAPGCR